ncbi:hypothetical protein [Lewinella sp. LCG006]|uniref:hypothetical protein n=1 Tax=Lewinella sp. LCG006 TaxID=3231911 RepID=UPI003460106D
MGHWSNGLDGLPAVIVASSSEFTRLLEQLDTLLLQLTPRKLPGGCDRREAVALFEGRRSE